MAVDYAAIAKKYGGVPSNPVTPTSDVDYAAIAKKYGGVPSNPVTPTSDVDYAAIAKKYGGVPTTPPSTPLAPVAEEQSIFRSAADVPLQLGAGAVGGVGLLADVLGVNNPVSQAIHGVESYLDSLLSAQAKNDQQEVSRIMQEAEDKGVKENVLAGFKALSVAPVDLVSRAVGYSAPTIAAIFAGAPAVVPVGVGALMGVGTVKSAIFDTVKSESMKAGLTEDKAEEVATQAQAYTGDNLDMIATGGFLGALSSLGIEKPLANIISQNVVKKLAGQGAAKAVAGKAPQSALKRSTTTGLIESGTEAGQAGQERYAANKAAQRAGYEVPTYRGVSGAAALEGLVGGVAGVGVGALKGPETEVDTKSDIEKELEEEIDKTIGKETYDEKLEFEILRKAAAAKGVSITPEDTIDTLADKIEQKDFEADMAKAPGQVELPPAQVIPEKLREAAAANGIEIAAEDTEEDVINKLVAKVNTPKQTLEEAETTAPVEEAVTPAPVEEAVTPAPVEEAVAPAPVEQPTPPAPVEEAVAPAPVEKAVAPAPVEQPTPPAPIEQPTPDYAPFSNLPGVTHVFKTARGSTYAHTETGQTVRNRSSKNHTDLTVGLQPTSGKTIYLTEAGVNTLGGVLQNVDIATQLVPAKIDGKDIAQVVLTEDYGTKKKGDVLAAAPYELTPRKGLAPVEIWRSESALGDDAKGIHFGNKIIEITPVEKTIPSAPVEEAVTPAPVKEAAPTQKTTKATASEDLISSTVSYLTKKFTDFLPAGRDKVAQGGNDQRKRAALQRIDEAERTGDPEGVRRAKEELANLVVAPVFEEPSQYIEPDLRTPDTGEIQPSSPFEPGGELEDVVASANKEEELEDLLFSSNIPKAILEAAEDIKPEETPVNFSVLDSVRDQIDSLTTKIERIQSRLRNFQGSDKLKTKLEEDLRGLIYLRNEAVGVSNIEDLQTGERLTDQDLLTTTEDVANGIVDYFIDRYPELVLLAKDAKNYFFGRVANLIEPVVVESNNKSAVELAVHRYLIGRVLGVANLKRTLNDPNTPPEQKQQIAKALKDLPASDVENIITDIMAENRKSMDFLYSIRKAGSLLPKDIIDLATSGKLMPVLSYIGANTKDPVIKRMITKILGMKLKTKLVVSPATDFEYPSRYDAKADTIFIDPSQLMEDVFLHEIIHPVLMAALNNPNLKVTKDFTDVFNKVKKLLPKEYGTTSVQEFASELLANADFRAKIKAASKTNLLTRIIKAIAEFFNFSSTSNPTLYDRAMVTLEGLIDVTAAGGEAINEGVDVSFIKEPQNLTAIKKKVEAVTTTHTELNENISALYKATRQAKNGWNDVVYTFLGTPQSAPRAQYILGVYSTDSLFKLAADAKLTPLERLKKLREKLYAYRIQIRQKDDRVINLLYKWASKDKSNSVKLGKAQNAARIVQVDPSIATLTEAINTDDIVQRYKDAARDSKNKRDKEYYEGRAKRRIEEIKYAYRQYNALDEQGKNLYKIMRDTYKQEILDYETIIKENIKVIIDAFKPKAGATPAEIDAYEKQIANLNKELSPLMKELFSERHKISVYFPLGRHGNFWVRFGTGKNGITETFDSREARDLALELRRNEMRKTAQQKNEVFDEGSISMGDDINELSNKLFGENNKLRSTVILKNAFEEIEKLSNRLDLDTATGELTVASAALEGLKENFLDLYLRTLPGSDLRKRYIRSKNKAGFTADVIRTFVNYSYRRSNQLPRAKYNARIINELDAAESFLEGMGPEEKASATKLTNEIKNRLGLELSPTVDSGFWDWLASTSNQATFLYIMTSFKSAIATATQLPIVGLPILADKYGYTKASSKALKHLGLLATLKTLTVKDFYQDANGVTNFDWRMPTLQDSSYVKNNARLVDAFQQGSLGQAFDSGFGYQFSKASEQPTAQYLSPVQKTKRGVYSLMTTSIVSMERIAREIMFISSYELEFEKALEQNLTSKEAHERAIEKAIDLTKEGMGNFTKENKPPIMYKTPIGKSLFQFMSFPMYMFGYLFRNFAGFFKALKDKNPAQAKSALVQLTGTYGAVFLLAGLPGLPLYSVFAGMLQGLMELLKDKEEEYPEDDPRSSKNMDLWIRRHGIPTYFGDDNALSKMFNIPPAKLQQAIEMGPLSALTDVNLQSFTSLDGLFLRDMAYGDDILSGINQFAKDFFLPPSIEATTQLMSSIEKINSGDFERGFEGLLPAFFRGSATASRLAKEGARTPSGDKLSTFEGKELNPEWYTTGKLIAVAGGFKDVTQSQIEKANSIAKKLDLQTQKQRTELVNRLDNAYQTLFIAQETKNTTAEKKALDLIDSVWAEMLEFNEVNPYYAFSEKTVNAGIENREKNRALASVLGGMRVDKDRIAYFMRILNRQ